MHTRLHAAPALHSAHSLTCSTQCRWRILLKPGRKKTGIQRDLTELGRKSLDIQKSEASRKSLDIQKSEPSPVRKSLDIQKSEASRKSLDIQKSEASRKSLDIQKSEASRKSLDIQSQNLVGRVSAFKEKCHSKVRSQSKEFRHSKSESGRKSFGIQREMSKSSAFLKELTVLKYRGAYQGQITAAIYSHTLSAERNPRVRLP